MNLHLNDSDKKVSEYDCTSQISGESYCKNIYVVSSYLRGLIEQFVVGDNALNKSINSLAFHSLQNLDKVLLKEFIKLMVEIQIEYILLQQT